MLASSINNAAAAAAAAASVVAFARGQNATELLVRMKKGRGAGKKEGEMHSLTLLRDFIIVVSFRALSLPSSAGEP